MRTWALVAAVMPLLGCSASIRRAVSTTDAAESLEQVTRSDANEFDPSVSPDGKEIAYEVAPTEDAAPHVEVMDLGDRRVEYSTKDTVGLEPTWMPDGSGLVFVSKTRGSRRGIVQTMGPGPSRTNFL